MAPKSYRLIFTSQIFTASPSAFSKENLDLYVGFVCHKFQNFTNNPVAAAMGMGKIMDYRSDDTTGWWLLFL